MFQNRSLANTPKQARGAEAAAILLNAAPTACDGASSPHALQSAP
jgi:hypothetical protein